MKIPLETIDSDVLIDICADQCGSKCCDMRVSDFHVRVNIEDYKRIVREYPEFTKLMVWDHGDPQLSKQPDGKCIFLDPQSLQCTIYEERPLDCRNYPYFMPEENIADHCLLYWNSSDDLRKSQKDQTHDVPNFSKTYDELTNVEKQYLQYLEHRPSSSINLDQIFSESVEYSTDNSHYLVSYNDEKILEEVEPVLDLYENNLDQLEFAVLSITGLDSNFDEKYHISGIARRSETTHIPRINHFPPSSGEFNDLLEWVNENQYLHLFGGYVFPQDWYEDRL